MKPESPKASSFVRRIGMPMAAAVSSLSRTATSRRATPLSRQIRTMKTDSSSTPSENEGEGLLGGQAEAEQRRPADEGVAGVGQAGAQRLVDAGHA